jgi:predicted heme/steroid binding protein/uncharacterized membrane protein
MKNYAPEELVEKDGEEGRPAFVAVDGKVYDVSASKRWPQGHHMKRHRAGGDLSAEILSAPHGPEVLGRFEMVGTLEQARKEPVGGLKGNVDGWLDAHPFFRRHPHPAVVHIPVGMFSVLPLFQIAALVFHSPAMEWTAFCCLVVGALSIPAAIATGYFTWWVNYDLADSPIIATKRRFAWTAFALAVPALLFRWYVVNDSVAAGSLSTIAYTLWVLVLAVSVGLIGFLGGKLTFPYESKK